MHARVKPSVMDMSWYRSAMRAVVVSRSPRVAGNEQGGSYSHVGYGVDSDDLIRLTGGHESVYVAVCKSDNCL